MINEHPVAYWEENLRWFLENFAKYSSEEIRDAIEATMIRKMA